MKRSELKVGQSVWYEQGKYHHGSNRATVIDTAKYQARSGYTSSGEPNHYQSDTGTLVLVRVDPDQWHPKPYDKAVPLGSLLGDYDTVKVEKEAAAARYKEAQAEAARKRAEADAKFTRDAAFTDALVAELKEAGFATATRPGGTALRVTLHTDELLTMFRVWTDAQAALADADAELAKS